MVLCATILQLLCLLNGQDSSCATALKYAGAAVLLFSLLQMSGALIYRTFSDLIESYQRSRILFCRIFACADLWFFRSTGIHLSRKCSRDLVPSVFILRLQRSYERFLELHPDFADQGFVPLKIRGRTDRDLMPYSRSALNRARNSAALAFAFFCISLGATLIGAVMILK
jgi:hypothetical protein